MEQPGKVAVDAGKCPVIARGASRTDAQAIRDALADRSQLISLFYWEKSPQGHKYWDDKYESGLTDEARAILQAWIDELEQNQK